MKSLLGKGFVYLSTANLPAVILFSSEGMGIQGSAVFSLGGLFAAAQFENYHSLTVKSQNARGLLLGAAVWRGEERRMTM